MDLKTLERMTVVKLREEGLKIADLSGVRAMSKEELIRAIAGALNIDLGARRRGGAGRAAVKKQVQELKVEIAAAIQNKNASQLKKLRRQVKRLKAQTRRLAKAKLAPQPAGGETATAPASG